MDVHAHGAHLAHYGRHGCPVGIPPLSDFEIDVKKGSATAKIRGHGAVKIRIAVGRRVDAAGLQGLLLDAHQLEQELGIPIRTAGK